jgi:crotonobetainyl-CoA:carnitine CoA-transferase CaiB-like acyl-CoA transferase
VTALPGQQERSEALASLRVSITGQSTTELLLAKILGDQGAEIAFADGDEGVGGVRAVAEPSANRPGDGDPRADIIVDAERGWPGPGTTITADMAASLVASGSIYCLFTGLPAGAPWQLPVTSESLIAAEIGLNRAPAQDKPAPEPLFVASGYAAVWAGICITAALRVQRQTGRGSRIVVPLFSAALSVIGRNLVTLDRAELIDPLSLPRTPIADIYRCRDGRFVQNHGTFQHFAEILCRVMGHDEWGPEAAAGLTSLSSTADTEQWRARFAAEFLHRDALDWERTLNAAGGACTMCRTHTEWRHEDGATSAGIVITDPGAAGGTEGASPGGSARLAATGPAVRISREAAPSPGERPTVRSSAWPAGPREVSLQAPLRGLRVVDFCIILAGPTCGRTLAELGADVIKIDSPGRNVSPYGWLDVNRGKRSVLADLKTPDGMKLARELIAEADVVLENFRSGKLEALGLGYEAVRAIRPDIVYASMNAFDYDGSWSGRAGWEHNAQAASGMQVARQVEGRPRAVPVPVNDYATGLLAALGVLLAVFRRDLTGMPAHVSASLARTATYLLLGESLVDPQSATAREAARSFRTSDGWIRIAAAGADLADAQSAAEISEQTSAEAVAALRQRGVLAATERTPKDLLDEDWMRSEGLLASWEHPHWGQLQQGLARLVTSEFEISPRWPAPDPGEHTEEIMRQLGYQPAQISHLLSTSAVASRRPLFSSGD